MEESRQGWRRGGKRRTPVTSGGKGWQSRRQPAAKTGTSRHRTRLVTLGLVTVSLLAAFIYYVSRLPREMPLIVLGATSYESPIPPNAFVREDASRLAGTNAGNIKLMARHTDDMSRETLERLLKANLHPDDPVSQKIVTVYLSAHGVVDSQGRACLLLSDAKPLDETTWYPISKLFELLDKERRDAVKVLLLDSGKIDANWSLGILYNSFPDRVAEELRNYSKIFVITDRASGQLAWSAPERGGTIFGHFVASGLSSAADADWWGGVSLLEFHKFVSKKVSAWVKDNRASDQTPLLIPGLSKEQDIQLVSGGAGPEKSGSAKERVLQLSKAWKEEVLPLWKRYEEFVREVDLERYDPLGLATIESELLRAEQLLLAGGAYEIEYTEKVKHVRSLMSDAAKPSLPDKLHGFSLPLAAQLEPGFDPETSGQELLKAWVEAGGWPKDEERNDKRPVPQSYLEAANVAVRWLLKSPGGPGGRQLVEAFRLLGTSERLVNDKKQEQIEHVQEVQLLKLVLKHADAPDAENWPSALRVALREAMLAQKMAEQIAAPADERVHYWVQPMLNTLDQRRRTALDWIFIGDDDSLVEARKELVQCQTQEGSTAKQRLDEVAAAYQLRDRVWSRLPHLAFWFSQQGRLDDIQPDLDSALQRTAELSALLDADDTTRPLDVADQHRSIVDELRAASERLESDFGQHVALLLEATPASGTLLEAQHVLRTPLTTARDREDLFLRRYLASMELSSDSGDDGEGSPSTDLPKLTRWPTHPAVILAGHDVSVAPSESDPRSADAVSWFNAQGGFVRDALGDISNKKLRLEQATEVLLRSEAADATARSTRFDLAKADAMVRSAAALLGQRPGEMGADPTRRLRHVDRHFQLLWHSHRVLEDFWGPTVSQRDQPYFANVANSYLDGAKTLEPGSRVLRYAEEADLAGLLRDRRVAATAIGITTEKADLKCYESDEPKETDYKFTVSWNQNLPRGQAAVFITVQVDNAERLFPVDSAQVRRRGQDVHNADSTVVQRLQLDKPPDRFELPLAAQVLFRGHEQSQQFIAKWPKHIMPVRAEYTHPEKATVTVEGSAEKTGYIMFIVDCSSSMENNDKMKKAKDALHLVLDELGNQPSYALGLRAYGRKAGFLPPADGEEDYQKDGQGKYLVNLLRDDGTYETVSKDPAGLHPDLDADDLLEPLALKVQKQAQADAIRKHIKDLIHNGVTPLYLALKTSLTNDFAGRALNQGDTKHILLITDGEDFFSRREAFGKTPTRTPAAAVLEAWKANGSDVQIHIIFMDRIGKVSEELKAIPDATGGVYKDANEVGKLVLAIQKAIGLVKFSVDPPGSITPDTPKYRLGDIAPVTDPRRDYEVRIHGAPDGQPLTSKIYLDGGEAAKLIYEHRLQLLPRLMFPIKVPPAAYGDPQFGRSRDGDEHKFVVRAHRPEVKRADVDFSVTVQDVTGTSERADRTEYFTPPVRQVWCEITPVEENTPLTDQRYYFYDVDNVLNEPIPKLRFHAKDWPPEAKKAEIQVWFSFHPFRRTPTGFQGITIEESGGSKQFSVPGLDGVAFDASGEQVSVDEPYRLTIHETNSPLGTAAIIVSPPADAISHTYYSFESSAAESGTAGDVTKHSFEFEKRFPVTIDVLPSSQFKKDPRVIAVPRLDVLVEE